MKKQKTKKKSKKSKVVGAILAIGLLGSVFGGTDEETPNTETQIVQDDTSKTLITESETTVVSKSDYSTIDEYLTVTTDGIEKKSNDMVYGIARIAKSDAQNITDSEINEAISFIRDTYPNYFVDDATMEKTMYYGCLLDYAFDDTDIRSELGTDANQVVKYVYREAEAVEDQATQENLSQIEKSLSRIDAAVKTEPTEENIQEVVSSESQTPVETQKSSESEKPVEEQTSDESEKSTESQTPVESEKPVDSQVPVETEKSFESKRPAKEEVVEEEEEETMVWIPKSGKKYHNDPNCSNMKNPTQVTQEKAEARGFAPCGKCY